MCKRINQRFLESTVETFTTGQPRGNLPNFDVKITSPNNRQHRQTRLSFSFMENGKKRNVTLNGRQARTLYEVLDRHSSIMY